MRGATKSRGFVGDVGFVGLERDYAITTVPCIILQPPFRSMIIVTKMIKPRFVNQFSRQNPRHFDSTSF